MKKRIQNPLKSSIILHSDNLIVNIGKKMASKIILMRHAESHFNYEINKIEKLHTSMIDSEYKKRKADIRFSSKFLDCEITENGKTQCQTASKQLEEVDIKYVIVSPMRRALQTCENTLSANSSSKPEVIVYPFIFEKMEDSCDIMKDLRNKMKEFSHYNWKYFETANIKENYQLDYCDVWPLNFEYNSYLNNYNESNEPMNKNNDCNTDIDQEKNVDIVLKAMRKLEEEDKYIESSFNTMERLSSFKSFINSFLTEKEKELYDNKKVLVIGHSVLFKHLTAKFIDEETYEPIEKNVFKNCQLAELSFL